MDSSSTQEEQQQQQQQQQQQHSIPRILNLWDVPLLSEGLDAGDILECYALVRSAPLHNALLPDTPITVHKVALGLRYRPLTVNYDATEAAKIREITLEYGPQRMGASLTQESMPSVQREQQKNGVDEFTTNSNDTDASGNSFLTWENEGKVYYTTHIASTGYISAYYMASVTGAVLGEILDKAVDYPMANSVVRGRPRRYQPFVVVDGSISATTTTDDDGVGDGDGDGDDDTILPPPGFEGERMPDSSTNSKTKNDAKRKILLKSSNSADFMHYMWETLAELGVSLNPILAPPTYQVQLISTGVEKVRVGPPAWVTHSAASFYDNLYMCIEAKVTGDYTKYSKAPTPSPKVLQAPSQAPSTEITNSTDTAPEAETDAPTTTMNDENDDGGAKRHLRADFPGTPESKQTDPPIDAVRDIEGPLVQVEHNSTILIDEIEDISDSDNSTISIHNNETLNQSASNYTIEHLPELFEGNATGAEVANVSKSPTPSPSWAPSVSSAPSNFKVSPQDTKSEVDEAQEAADVAQQAASEAKDAAKTDVDSKAADAAQVAANAAQKAATATNTAAAQSAMDAFLSGDGASIVPIISPCFSDPQFGISTLDENGSLVTHAYIYIDGSSYYKVNLTFPFVQVVPVEHTLPQPPDLLGQGAGGDFIDWCLALLLLSFSVFGILLLVQQNCGGYITFFKPLYKLQRWFFNPLHYKDDEEERKLAQNQQGQGQAYSFGEDVIPVSMGGRRASGQGSPLSQMFRRKPSEKSNDEGERIPLNGSGEHQEDDEVNKSCEIELTEARTPLSQRSGRYSRGHSCGSSHGSVQSEDSDTSPPVWENGSYSANGIVGNIELVETDDRERDYTARLSRDPDLVELPNLKSSSKVAVPASGHKRTESFYSTGGNTL